MSCPLEEIAEIINSPEFQKDYKKASERKLKAPANRVKKTMQQISLLVEKAKDEMDVIRKG